MSGGGRFTHVFLDADGTLFDFDRAEDEAIRLVFEEFDFPFDEAARDRYKEVNSGLWRAFERGEVGKDELQRRRFATILEERGLAGDADAVNVRYLHHLSENVFLLDGAVEACAFLAAKATLLLATNGVSWTQRRRLANSPLAPYFTHVCVSEEAGAQKPSPVFFDYALGLCGRPEPGRVLMVGDLLRTDIRGGAEAGMATCWYNPSAEPAPEDAPRIDAEIRHLSELERVFAGGAG